MAIKTYLPTKNTLLVEIARTIFYNPLTLVIRVD